MHNWNESQYIERDFLNSSKNTLILIPNYRNFIDLSIRMLLCYIIKTRPFNFKDIMTEIVKTVNFMLSRGLIHQQFQEFLNQIEALTYFSIVRWLGRGNCWNEYMYCDKRLLCFLSTYTKLILIVRIQSGLPT